MGSIMESLGMAPDTDAVARQEKLAKEQERKQALELNKRRATLSSQSKTIFSAVEGNASTVAKKTKLGG